MTGVVLIPIFCLIADLRGSRSFFTNPVLWKVWTPKPQRPKELPPFVELLGNPSASRFPEWMGWKYSRNVWAMQRFNRKIYLGAGDSDLNTGPVPIWYFDPKTNQFEIDTTSGGNYKSAPGCVDEERISQFRIISGKLVIPGLDPRESWDLGNFYRKETNGWIKYRTIPDGVHTFDICKFNNRLFAAIGVAKPESSVIQISDDDGRSWQSAMGTRSGHTVISRAYSLFQLAGNLYATTPSWLTFRYNGKDGFTILPAEKAAAFFPGEKSVRLGQFPSAHVADKYADLQVVAKQIFRPLNFKDRLVYIGLDVWPLPPKLDGLFEASVNSARRINLPDQVTVRDIKISDDQVLYVLCDRKMQPSRDYLVQVYASADLHAWTCVTTFQANTFARSFEILDGGLYFGCGSEEEDVADSTGDILRIRSQYLTVPN